MLVFKCISHLVANHFCTPDFCVDIGMRMAVNPCIYPAAGYQFSYSVVKALFNTEPLC